MSSRDITIIILLLIVLAILYKVFQASKLQTELATKMAGKMGIVIAKPKRKEEEEEDDEDEETEETEHEEVEEEVEEEEQEDEGKDEEIDVQEEDQNGKRLGSGKAVILKVSKPRIKKKEKLKTYQIISSFFTDSPLYARQIIEKYHEQFGKVKPNEVWVALNYSIKKGVVLKYMVSEEPKKYIYGTPEMFEGSELKPEYQSKI